MTPGVKANDDNRIRRIASGAPWEPIAGYARAVRAGGWIAVSGTTSFDETGKIVGKGQMYVQARQAIANIAAALEHAGVGFGDVVRTRIFVTDLERFEEVARAHRESFGAAPPASTAVEVRRLLHPDMMIEIEADAFAPSPSVSGAHPASGMRKSVTKRRSGSAKTPTRRQPR
jgi:enamine deaminase RidA (YjgF/YER057c/UK114 family)